MSQFVEATLGVDEESPSVLLVGDCDIFIQNLTSGEISVYLKFPQQTNFRPMSGATFTQDTASTIFFGEHGIEVKLVGNGNNAGVYVRLARGTV